MKKGLLLACCLIPAYGQLFSVNFSSSTLDFSGGNGSFASDHFVNPAGFVEIGGLGLANSGGSFSYHLPTPADFTGGHGSFGTFVDTIEEVRPNPFYDSSRPEGPFNMPTITNYTTSAHTYSAPLIDLRAAPGNSSEPWVLTFFDNSGGRESLTFTPQTAPGVFSTYSRAFGSDALDVDWTDIAGFEISGDGSTDPFHAGFQRLTTIPEPSAYSAAFGTALAGFAVFRMRSRAKQLK